MMIWKTFEILYYREIIECVRERERLEVQSGNEDMTIYNQIINYHITTDEIQTT